MRNTMRWIVMVWVVCGLGALVVRAEAGGEDVQEFLERLEHADDDVQTFQAKIRFTKRHKMIGDEITRGGELVYRVGEDGRTFAVVFDTLDMDGQRNTIDERLVFDGRFLVEKNEAQKMYTRRELAPEGERIDPLQLGEGPIPIPIGQKAEEIQLRYDAEVLPFDEGKVGKARAVGLKLHETVQLRLVPKPEFAASDDFAEVRVWYIKGELHPRLAYTVNRAGDESFVVLINAEKNGAAFDDSLLEIEPPDEAGWQVQEIEGHFAARASGDQE